MGGHAMTVIHSNFLYVLSYIAEAVEADMSIGTLRVDNVFLQQ